MAKLDPLNTSRYWHAPDLPGMDLLHADFRTHENTRRMCMDAFWELDY